MKSKKGKIIPNGVSLEKHENEAIVLFTELGYEIELIPPLNSPKSKTPDFIMGGIAWELKCPQGKSKISLEHIFRKATKQSGNIIIDLLHSKMKEEAAIKEIKRCFKQTGSCRRLKIITKSRKILEYQK